MSSPHPLGHTLRLQARKGELTAHTSGLAPNLVQGNLMILPAQYASDFLLFCQRNPKPCPLLGVSAPGETRFDELGRDIDIRTDLPRYRVWRDGQLVDEPQEVRGVWRDDLVSFVIGCSFSFEQALLDSGPRCVMWRRAAMWPCTAPIARRWRPAPFTAPWWSRCGP